jgi:hypothetical protein
LQRAAQTALANWGPLSEVICAGTPNLDTQPLTKAVAQLSAVVLERGIASTHRCAAIYDGKDVVLPKF